MDAVYWKKRITGFYYLICSCRVPQDWLRTTIIYDHPRPSCLQLYFSCYTAACSHSSWPGPWFNIKMSYQYRKSHCGDKTVLRPPYVHNGISYTGKRISLYWIRGPGCFVTFLTSCTSSAFVHNTISELMIISGTIRVCVYLWECLFKHFVV